MAKNLTNLVVILAMGAIASLLVQVAVWNELVGTILITLALIGMMFVGVNVTIRIVKDGDLETKGDKE